MPRVTICWYEGRKEYLVAETAFAGYDPDSGVEVLVDMNASLFRQIKHAEKQHQKFQEILRKLHLEALEHPNSVRRAR